jgi:hypothetical protein
MGMVATEGLKALRKRWTGVDAYLLGDDTVTRPSFKTGYVKWYDASEGNRKYATPVTEWPRFDPKKMKQQRSGSKRKAKDAPTPVPLSHKAMCVFAGSLSKLPKYRQHRVEPWGHMCKKVSKRNRVEPSDWDELE